MQVVNNAGTVTKSYRYDAFGVEIDPDVNDLNPWRYAGECFDRESGNYYLRARYYNPRTGRFMQQDPIKDGLNWYTYASGNPVNRIDPWGLKDYTKTITSGIKTLSTGLTFTTTTTVNYSVDKNGKMGGVSTNTTQTIIYRPSSGGAPKSSGASSSAVPSSSTRVAAPFSAIGTGTANSVNKNIPLIDVGVVKVSKTTSLTTITGSSTNSMAYLNKGIASSDNVLSVQGQIGANILNNSIEIGGNFGGSGIGGSISVNGWSGSVQLSLDVNLSMGASRDYEVSSAANLQTVNSSGYEIEVNASIPAAIIGWLILGQGVQSPMPSTN